MSSIPVVRHLDVSVTHPETRLAERLAEQLIREQPRLAIDAALLRLVPKRLEDAPTLHLDDLSDIHLIDRFYGATYLQDRARLRAATGDYVASCSPRCEAYETYSAEQLGLGSVTWVHPRPGDNSLRIAPACWTDRSARHSIIHALRAHDLRYVHPHIGTAAIWTIAQLFQKFSRRPLKVIAPHPRLTECVNDKTWFAYTTARLFGKQYVPLTRHVHNFATLARVVLNVVDRARYIVFKLPASAGGAGNVVLDGRRFQGHTPGEVRSQLKAFLAPLGWSGRRRLLVGSWETEVLCTPSAQLWIPPEAEGPPIVEGLFEQVVEGPEGIFAGCRPAALPTALTQELANRCWLLARLYQRLGYIGRCSFDLILVGQELDNCRIEFVECNGRWGGASLPMTLMNRLFGDWYERPYATQEYSLPGLERFEFSQLLEHFSEDLFDARTGKGRLVLWSPGAIQERRGIDILAMGDTWEAAIEAAATEFPRRLRDLVATQTISR